MLAHVCTQISTQARTYTRSRVTCNHPIRLTCTHTHTNIPWHPHAVTRSCTDTHAHTPSRVHAHTYTPVNTKNKHRCTPTRTHSHLTLVRCTLTRTLKHTQWHTASASSPSLPHTMHAHPLMPIYTRTHRPPLTLMHAHVHNPTLAICSHNPTLKCTESHPHSDTLAHMRSELLLSRSHVTDPSSHFQKSSSFDKIQLFHLAHKLANLRLPPPPHSITRLK